VAASTISPSPIAQLGTAGTLGTESQTVLVSGPCVPSTRVTDELLLFTRVELIAEPSASVPVSGPLYVPPGATGPKARLKDVPTIVRVPPSRFWIALSRSCRR
jgi:hypothetical protein